MKRRPNKLLEKPIFQFMPPLSAEEYEALKADIGEHGVQVPVEMDENGAILDGHHRVKACQELGIKKWPTVIRIGLSPGEKRQHTYRLNLARRHFTQEQKRALIKEQLKETPEKSNNGIARLLGVSDKTVQTVRKDLEGTSEIPKLNRLVGNDGKERPQQMPHTKPSSLFLATQPPQRTFDALKDLQEATETQPEKYGKVFEKMTRHGQVQGYHRQLLAERRNKNLYAHPPGLKPPTPEGRAATINRTPPFGDFEISIGRNEAGANLHTLVEEKKTLPRFQQKQEEIEALRKQAEELEREAFRLRQLAGEKSGELSDAIRDELEGEHGPIYPFIETWITTIHDPALKAQLEQLEESDGEQALAILKESWSSGKIEKLCYGQWGDMWFGNYKKWAREEVTTAIPLPPWTEPPTVEESKAAIEELWPVVQTQLKAAELPAD